jgi:hypothetical protein
MQKTKTNKQDHLCAWFGMAAALLFGIGGAMPALAQVENSSIRALALVFSPAVLGAGQQANLCAANWTERTVPVEFVFRDAMGGHVLATQTANVQPETAQCASFGNLRSGDAVVPSPLISALIGLVSPGPCRVLVSPGPCKVIGSLEISDAETGGNRVHTEPTLLPAVQMPGPLNGTALSGLVPDAELGAGGLRALSVELPIQ